MTLVVLAAGMGSRFKGLKQVAPITEAGEFIIDFSAYDALRAGYNKIVFIIKRDLYDVFHASIGARLEPHIKVEYVFQEKQFLDGVNIPAERVKPFGTGHALLACLGVVNEPFTVINADDFYGAEAYRCVADYLRANPYDGKCHLCMAGYTLSKTLTENGTVSRGECYIDQNGYLVGITERVKISRDGDNAKFLDGEAWLPISGNTTVSMNFFGFTPEALDFIKNDFIKFIHRGDIDLLTAEYYLPSAVTSMLGEGLCDVKVLRTNDRWYGVTYPDDKETVVNKIAEMIKSGVYPDGLWRK